MWIDLRYVIVLGVFYVPGLLILIGAWLLGYSTAEAREFVAIMGVSAGIVASGVTALGLFVDPEGEPTWLKIPLCKEKNDG